MNLPGTSATFSHITMSAASRPYPLSPISLLPIFPTSERHHSHHRTPSRSSLCYTHSSSPPSRYMIVRLTSRPYPLSPISLLLNSPLYVPFLLLYTTNFPTRTYHLHFALIPFLSMFSSHSRLSSHLLPRFGHCFPLPTRTRYLFYTCTVTYLYALRHPLYVHHQLLIRTFSGRGTYLLNKSFKVFVQII